jgi:hypothetical protein
MSVPSDPVTVPRNASRTPGTPRSPFPGSRGGYGGNAHHTRSQERDHPESSAVECRRVQRPRGPRVLTAHSRPLLGRRAPPLANSKGRSKSQDYLFSIAGTRSGKKFAPLFRQAAPGRTRRRGIEGETEARARTSAWRVRGA